MIGPIRFVVIAGLTAALLASMAMAQDAAPLADLTERIKSEDAAVRTGAFDDLLAMGSEGIEALLGMLVDVGEGDDAGARFALHGMAARAAQPDQKELRGRLVPALAAYLGGEAPVSCRQFIVAQLQMIGGADSVPALAPLLRDERVALTAIQALTAIPDETAPAALRDALPDTQGAVRVGIIEALGEHRDGKAVALLIAEAGSDAAGVRAAALEALGRIGDAKAAPTIYSALGDADPRAQRSAFNACLLLGESLLASGDENAGRRVYGRALEAAATPAQRSAALLGMGKVATADDVTALLPHLADPDPQVRHAAAQCLVELDGPEAGAALAEASRDAEPDAKMELLGILSQREEPAAARAIEAATRDDNVWVRVTALGLLERLGDPAVEEVLVEAIKTGPGPAYGSAVEAYLQQARARLDQGDRDRARSMYAFVLDLAATDELRRMAIDGLGSIADTASLAAVEARLDNAALREPALRAYVAIARSVADAGDNDKAIEMLQKALELGPPRDVTQSAVAKLRDLGIDIDPAKASGFVTHWWIMGPFSGSNVDDEYPPEASIDLDAAAKVDDRELTWVKHHTADPSGIVNLAGMMDPNNNTTAYLYAEVTVEQAQDVLFKTGSDDGMKLWLNGEVVHRFPHPRSLRVDEDTIETRLESGTNKLLYKVVQGGGGWECCLRITDREGKPIKFDQKEQ